MPTVRSAFCRSAGVVLLGVSVMRLLAPFALAAVLFVAAPPVFAEVPNWSEDCLSSDYDVAIDGCTALLRNKHQLPSDRAATFANRGYARMRSGDNDAAIDDYGAAIDLVPDYAIAYAYRGVAHENNGDYDDAIADYSKAIEIDPKDNITFTDRGRTYYLKGDLAKAMADYDKSVALDPNYAAAHDGRGTVLRDQGDLDGAIAAFSNAIKAAPDDGFYYGNRGGAYEAKGDFQRALADYEAEVSRDPKSAYAQMGRGNVYAHMGDYAKAIAAYNVAIPLDPNDGFNYLSRALAYFFSGDSTKALADLSQSAKLDPQYAYTPLWIDIIGQRNKQPGKLATSLGTIDMSAWPAPIIKMYLGQTTPAQVMQSAQDPDPVARKGQVCEVNLYSAELALRQGMQDEAIRMFQVAAKDCPFDYLESAVAAAELKALGVAP
jgi:tetratricopeptide (TPR) repeat protein